MEMLSSSDPHTHKHIFKIDTHFIYKNSWETGTKQNKKQTKTKTKTNNKQQHGT